MFKNVIMDETDKDYDIIMWSRIREGTIFMR